MSSTERIALQSGTPGIERLAFDGSLTSKSLQKYKPHALTATDQKMIAKAPALLATVDESEILRRRVTPPEHRFWNHAKREGFFGLIVPDKYGGHQMSNTGLSKLLQGLSSCSASVPVHVMVPASLGPAELLAHYGTDEQRERFLPKLARGSIPCFGLTSADAGSDAAGSMVDTGHVECDSSGEVTVRLNCAKRYITLAPVADIVGIAFRLIDDENRSMQKLCGRDVDGEITLALVERGRAGLKLGPYSDPLGVGFANGTVEAVGLELKLNDVIGGTDGVGRGWKFLMEALAAGRGIALPAGASGSSKMLTNAVAGYASIRTQFKVPLASFEGIQEKLADMALCTYEIDSLVELMNCALDDGERPPVLSAILKQRSTELGRRVVLHSMDIVAGAAICMGPRNFVAPAYLSSPIGITVEGSNTMTRSLLIFGQGVVRSHPHLLKLLGSIEEGDKDAFGALVRRMVCDNVSLFVVPFRAKTPLEEFVHFFALSANTSLVLGGDLKRREFISGRYADILSHLLAGFAMEWNAANLPAESRPTDAFLSACRDATLYSLQEACKQLIENHPHTAVHRLLYNRKIGSESRYTPVSDRSKRQIVKELTTNGSTLRNAFDRDVIHAHPTVNLIRQAMTDPKEADRLRSSIIQTDVFALGEDGHLHHPASVSTSK